jgi:hypothetical protein
VPPAKFPTAAACAGPPPVSIEFRNLSYEIKTRVGWRNTRRQVLHDISGSARPKSVLAIMGPTGDVLQLWLLNTGSLCLYSSVLHRDCLDSPQLSSGLETSHFPRSPAAWCAHMFVSAKGLQHLAELIAVTSSHTFGFFLECIHKVCWPHHPPLQVVARQRC